MENTVQMAWESVSSVSKAANNLLTLLFPEGKEGVDFVDDPIPAIFIRVKNLGVVIDPYHVGTAVSNFARNTEGNIVGILEGWSGPAPAG